jgi:hypothetical protein
MNKFKPNKEHIYNLLSLLHAEVVSSSGDGDSMWYTRYYDINDIKQMVDEYNNDYALRWKVEFDGNTILWGEDQEGVTITDDANLYDTAPDWIQMKIRY